jgi:acetylglutamate kinase
MVDRGFLISGILNDMGVKLHMSSLKGTERTQLTTSQTIRFENIFKVRIHVERATQRIKTFHILDGEDKLSMKDIAEQIFTVCA